MDGQACGRRLAEEEVAGRGLALRPAEDRGVEVGEAVGLSGEDERVGEACRHRGSVPWTARRAAARMR
jgi:hypothetical protein